MRLRFAFLYLIIPLFLRAQQLVSLPSTNLFPTSTVETVYQDKDGYMWYGTRNGLYRCDGYDIVPVRLNVLLNEKISHIIEPRPGYLWMGTGHGLFILDKNTFKVHELSCPEVKGKNITCFYVAKDNSVYIGTRGTLVQVSPEGKLLDKFTIKSHGVYCEVHSISDLPNGDLLICMDWDGLCRLDKHHRRIIDIPQEASCNTILRDDANHCYWIGTWGQGLFCYNPISGRFQQQPGLKRRGKGAGKVIWMVRDERLNYLWVAMLDNLYAYKIDTGNLLEPVDITGIIPSGRKMLTYILKDWDGNIWLPALDGNNMIISMGQSVMRRLPMDNLQNQTGYVPLITSLYKGEKDYLWFSSERSGLYLYNERSGHFISYKENKVMASYPFLFTSRIVGSRTKNKVWVASENYSKIFGVCHDGDRLRLEDIIDLEQFSRDVTPVQSIYEAENGCLWVGTSKDIWLYNPQNKWMRRICSVKGSVTGFTEQKNDMWICCRNNGIFRVRKPHISTGKSGIVMYPLAKDFSCIASQPDGSLLLGTDNGEVYGFYIQNKKGIFKRYRYLTEPEGGRINDIRVDGTGNCWILTGRQLRKYYISNNRFYDYSTSSDRLSGVSAFYSMTLYGKDTYIGGRGGILITNASDRPLEKEQMRPVQISDIKVGKTSLLSEEGERDVVSYTKGRVELEADSRNIQFSFSTLDLLNAPRIQYAYRLKGVDNEWNYTKVGYNTAFYNKLDKGTYTLEVKATDANGVWGKKVTTVTVVRLPAWYETWWAYTLWFLMGAGLIVFIWNLYLQKIRRENEAELAKRITDMKLKYYTNISHDLLTPLTTTGCVVDELEQEGTADRHLLQLMRMNLNHLKRLLQQVLDFRKLERGGMKLHVAYGDLTKFVGTICETGVLPLARQKHITFQFSSSPKDIKGYFDADKLDRILYNLCSNALKYTPENHRITLSLTLEQPYVELTVRDTGIGIAASELPLIFKRFYNNKQALPGTSHGIGLSMVKELVELHHGTISVESKEGVGSAFHVRLPINKESFAAEEVIDGPAALPASEIVNMKVDTRPSSFPAKPVLEQGTEPYTLLLVEDNTSLLEVMHRLFAGKYQVLTAENGREALEILKQKDVDIMVSDVMMPEMDGVELCKAVRTDVDICHLLIVLLTAKTQSEYQVEYYRAGADAYVAKPFDTAVLQSHLETLLHNREIRQKNFKSSTVLSITPLQTSHLDTAFLQDAVRIVETYISDSSFGVQELADTMNMSRSSLVRKLKKLTGQPPLEFIRNIKMKQACLLLKNKDIPIGEIVLKLGYNDVRYFAKSFREEFGMAPVDYRKRYL